MNREHPPLPSPESLSNAMEVDNTQEVEALEEVPPIVILEAETQDLAPKNIKIEHHHLRLVASGEREPKTGPRVGVMTYRITRASSFGAGHGTIQRAWTELLDLLMRVGDGMRFRLTVRAANEGDENNVTSIGVACSGDDEMHIRSRLLAFHRRVTPWLAGRGELLFECARTGEDDPLVMGVPLEIVELAPRERAGPWGVVPWLPTRQERRSLADSLRVAGAGVAVVLVLEPALLAPAELAHFAAHPDSADSHDRHRFLRRLFLVADHPIDVATAVALGSCLVGIPGRIAGSRGGADGFELLRPSSMESTRALHEVIRLRSSAVMRSDAPRLLQRIRSLAAVPELARILPASELAAHAVPSAPCALPLTHGARIGRVLVGGKTRHLRLSDADAGHHSYVVGASGRGKSTLLLNLALDRAAEGHGVILLDPHGDFANDFMRSLPAETVGRVVLVDATDLDYPVGLNPLRHDPDVRGQRSFVVNELFRIFESLWDMKNISGPIFEQYLRNALGAVLQAIPDEADLLHLTRIFTDEGFRKETLNLARDPFITVFWKDVAEQVQRDLSLKEMAPYITSKVDALMSDEVLMPMLLQVEKHLDIGAHMDAGDLVVVRLEKGRLGRIATRMLGMITVMRLLSAALARASRPQAARRPVHVFVDEVQNFLTPTLAEMIAEARKFGVRLTFANQNLAQVPAPLADTLLGNVANLVVCGVGDGDARRLAETMGTERLAPWLTTLAPFRAVVRLRTPGAPLEVALPPPPTGCSEAEWEGRLARIRKRSRAACGTTRQLVLDAIASRHGMPRFSR